MDNAAMLRVSELTGLAGALVIVVTTLLTLVFKLTPTGEPLTAKWLKVGRVLSVILWFSLIVFWGSIVAEMVALYYASIRR